MGHTDWPCWALRLSTAAGYIPVLYPLCQVPTYIRGCENSGHTGRKWQVLGWHGICLLPGPLGLGLDPSSYGIDGILLRNWEF